LFIHQPTAGYNHRYIIDIVISTLQYVNAANLQQPLQTVFTCAGSLQDKRTIISS